MNETPKLPRRVAVNARATSCLRFPRLLPLDPARFPLVHVPDPRALRPSMAATSRRRGRVAAASFRADAQASRSSGVDGVSSSTRPPSEFRHQRAVGALQHQPAKHRRRHLGEVTTRGHCSALALAGRAASPTSRRDHRPALGDKRLLRSRGGLPGEGGVAGTRRSRPGAASWRRSLAGRRRSVCPAGPFRSRRPGCTSMCALLFAHRNERMTVRAMPCFVPGDQSGASPATRRRGSA